MDYKILSPCSLVPFRTKGKERGGEKRENDFPERKNKHYRGWVAPKQIAIDFACVFAEILKIVKMSLRKLMGTQRRKMHAIHTT